MTKPKSPSSSRPSLAHGSYAVRRNEEEVGVVGYLRGRRVPLAHGRGAIRVAVHLGGAQLAPLGSWRGEKGSVSSLKSPLLLEARADGDPEKRLSPALSPLDLTHAQPETLRPDPSLTLLRASPGVASGGEPYFSGVDFRDQITAVLHVH